MSKHYCKFQKLLKIPEKLHKTLKIPMDLKRYQNGKIQCRLAQKNLKQKVKIRKNVHSNDSDFTSLFVLSQQRK